MPNSNQPIPPLEGWRLCGHCEGTGTCHSAEEGGSCESCAMAAKVADPKAFHRGLPCQVCHGHGCGAPFEVKTNRLMGAYVTIFLSTTIIGTLWIAGFCFEAHFKEVLTFAGTILGSLTGFYFGGSSKKS